MKHRGVDQPSFSSLERALEYFVSPSVSVESVALCSRYVNTTEEEISSVGKHAADDQTLW